jgi:hypothetical protein
MERKRLRRNTSSNVVKSLQPLELDREHNPVVRKLMVFREGQQIAFSVIADEGSVNFSLKHAVAAELIAALAEQLAKPIEPDNNLPQPQTRIAVKRR